MVTAIGAAEHAGAGNGIYRTWTPTTGKDTVHVDHVIVDVLAVAQIFPMLAAVRRADRTADLYCAVEVSRLAGAGVEHQHALRRVGVGRGRDLRKAHADGQAGPMLAGIVAAVDLAVLASDKDHVGIVRMEQDRPHWQAVVGQLNFLPVLTTIVTAIGPGLRSGVNDLAF